MTEVVAAVDGLSPEEGVGLARMVGRHASQRVVLDFSGFGIASSSFANAFFVELSTRFDLASLDGQVDFVNLGPRLLDVWRKSYRAVRARLAASPAPAKSAGERP